MSAASTTPPLAAARRNHLYGPLADFLLLGGGSLIALAGIVLYMRGQENPVALSMGATMLLANLINHPHFAHSYQIFYSGFGQKLARYPADLRKLYWLSGVLIPVLLAALLATPLLLDRPDLLGLGANAMAFFVGWHYVKQGYGMAMVDAVLKRAFYNDAEKHALLHNAYAVWIASWLLVNHMLQGKSEYWGIPFTPLPVPMPVLMAGAGVAVWTTLKAILLIADRHRTGTAVAWNGLLAYAVSLYVWLLVQHPIVLLWVPLFHSLQYLAVVWRYRINLESSHDGPVRPPLKLALFGAIGLGSGYVAFWGFPTWLDANVAYDHMKYGDNLFLFMAWIFINIHHYFLDTVMWRKGNPDVQQHLFRT